MLMFSLIKKLLPGFSFIYKSPRFVAQLLLFIVLILLIFLYHGCSLSSGAFSNLYLVKYSYNPTYGQLETNATVSNITLSSLEVRAGFAYVCVAEKTASAQIITCAHRNNLTFLNDLVPAATLTTLDHRIIGINLMDLASGFMTKITHPSVPFASVIIVALALLFNLWASLPTQVITRWGPLLATVVTFVACVVWTVATIWIFVACRASTTLIGDASIGVVTASAGTRAAVVAWVSFAGLVIATGLAGFILYVQTIARAQLDLVNAMDGKV